MSDILASLSDKMYHLNMLFLLGLALFGGTIGGRFFEKIKIPKVVGYIIIGIIIGQSGFKIVDKHTLQIFQPFNSFALGLIGFLIGGELKKDVFKKYGKQFMYILLFEGIMAFVFVTLLIGIVCHIFLGNMASNTWALAILLGAISVSTAPAATTGVLWEYKTRGPLTTTVLGIVAMDDGLGLLIFAFASSIAASMVGKGNGVSLAIILSPLYEIGGALILGIIFGAMICYMLRKSQEEDKILAFSIGTILLLVGFSMAIEVDMILAAMSLGAIVINYSPRKSEVVFELVEKFTPPIYILFFVLVGAKLNVSGLSAFTGTLVVLYLIGRASGKLVGATLGAKLSGAPEMVRRYLPLCLLSQAGVAIGLSIFAGEKFPGEIGNMIIVIIACTTFVVEIIGPPFVKVAVEKAGEVGLNITEEDLIKKCTAKDLLDIETPIINEGMHLPKILITFSENNKLYYPVVNNPTENVLRGIISVDSIKNTLMVPELKDFLVAHDIMEPVVAVVRPELPVSSVNHLFKAHNVNYLPVVANGGKVLGIVEEGDIKRLVSRKVLELQNKVNSLG
jgi:Kef-type K+ transport system membrane component KefB